MKSSGLPDPREPRRRRQIRVKHLATAALVAVLAMCALSASAYAAGPTPEGALTNEMPVKGEVTKGTPEGVSYTFNAVAGKHVTLAISAPHVEGALELKVRDENGAEDAGGVSFNTGPTDINFTPNASQAGSTTVIVSPTCFDCGGSTGNFTLTYAEDVTGELVSGRPMAGAVKVEGQRADYTFQAVTGQHVTVAVTSPHVEGSLNMSVLDASGAEDSGSSSFNTSPTDINFTPNATEAGLTTVSIAPDCFDCGASTGSFTLTYATDVTGTLSAGVPTSGAVDFEGQRADYTFNAVAGQPVKLSLTNPHVEGSLSMSVSDSSGAEDTTPVSFNTAPAELEFTPTATEAGLTTVTIAGTCFDCGASTGTFTLTYNPGAAPPKSTPPPSSGSKSTTPPANGEAALAAAFGLPSAKLCYRRGSFALRLEQPHGRATVVSVEVFIGSRRVRTLGKGQLHQRVVLHGLPRGSFKLRIVARTATGKTLTGARTYHMCQAGTPLA